MDVIDRLLLFGATTIAGLLVTDWVARRVARQYYRLPIERFVGWAVAWRQGVAGIVWGLMASLLIVSGVLLATGTVVDATARLWMTRVWIVIISPLCVLMALGSVGWAAHHVFARESGRGSQATVASQSLESVARSLRAGG